jgi:predicted ATPase
MRIQSIRLQNFRSFVDSGDVELNQINVLIGANNSGKSSVLRGIHMLQHGIGDPFADVRVGASAAEIDIRLTEIEDCVPWGTGSLPEGVLYQARINSPDRRGGNLDIGIHWSDSKQKTGDMRLPAAEPHHFIVPFLSKRKTANYQEDIREEYVVQIASEMTNLAAKLSRLANPQFPAYKQYSDACKAILGFVVTVIPSAHGQRPGVYLPNDSTLPIDQMGEGVPNIVALLCSLAVSKKKLFLIEEPENDLHPVALKALLDLVIVSSEHNQFVISTHSNIVVSQLCSQANSHLLQVTSERGVLPTLAKIASVPQTPAARIKVLHDLGYAFSDYHLWDGWLFLEESSAERIIREYLIPWFAPILRRVRTVAAGGVDAVEPLFADFHRLFLFIHLQAAYAGRTWVRVDGDDAGRKVIEGLRKRFSSFGADAFSCWSEKQFEHFYPSTFSGDVTQALSLSDKQDRRTAKRELLDKVVKWIDADQDRARQAFAESAHPVIEDLQAIGRSLDTISPPLP